ncbi:hypothetical protein [Salinisphaera sp. T31B1]|uniref:hypothetical protein n=1 Tax=Salinisphaera sp. T31B1 TaxID=727963 RepID=UPI0033428D58
MIFAPIPSPSWLIVATISAAALCLCASAGVALWLNPRLRRASRRHPTARAIFFALAGLLSLPFILSQGLTAWALGRAALDEQARRQTLDTPTIIQQVNMPRSTRLVLREPGQLETFERAAFPEPITVYGFRALAMRRILGIDDTGRRDRLHSAMIELAEDQPWSGWHCTRDTPVAVELGPDGRLDSIRSCRLATEYDRGAITLPADSEIRASAGTRYVSGRRGRDRWIVSPPRGTALAVGSLRLNATLFLDRERRPLRARGVLADPLALGGIHYPRGTATRIRFDADTARVSSWFMSPTRDGIAARDNGGDIVFGQAVAHGPGGDVVEITDNTTAGFHHLRPLRTPP